MNIHSENHIPKVVIHPDKKQESPVSVQAQSGGLWGSDGFSFSDILDFINPLQHIPVVSTIYRAITGDEIGVAPRLVGGAVLGGVVGLSVAAADCALQAATGKDTGETILAAAGVNTEKMATESVIPPTAYAKVQAYQRTLEADADINDRNNPWV